jgi:hypothetical protein
MADEQYNDLETDIDNIGKFANDPAGTVQPRQGVPYKNIRKIVADAESLVANRDIGAGAAALINQRIQANTVPQLTSAVGANAAGGTTYILTTAYGVPFTDGSLYDFIVPADNAGPISLNYANNVLQLYDAANNAISPKAFSGGSLIRVRLNLGGARYNLVTILPSRDALGGIKNNSDAAKLAFENYYKLPIAGPLDGNPNNIGYNSFTTPANNATWKAIIATNNTGPTFIYANGVYLRVAFGGTGNDIPANTLIGGQVASFTRSDGGGNIAIFNGMETLAVPTTPIPVASQDDDLAYNPWGTVPSSGGVVTPIVKNIVVPGSSNAAAGYTDGFRPSDMITTALNDAYVGTGINFVADLQAVQGAPYSAASGQLQASAIFMAKKASFVVPFFWMNDCRTIFYHDYGGVRSQFNALIGLIDYIRSMGAEPVIPTGFNPDPRANPAAATKALDPTYFSDNPGQGSSFSPVKGAPVSPTADMVPAGTVADFMVQRDWSSSGNLRTGYKRIWHFNRTVREICAAKKCSVLDFEWSTYRNCIETVADLSAGLDTFYDSTNPLHPKAPLYNLGLKPVITQWARAVADGRDDIRVYRGV